MHLYVQLRQNGPHDLSTVFSDKPPALCDVVARDYQTNLAQQDRPHPADCHIASILLWLCEHSRY